MWQVSRLKVGLSTASSAALLGALGCQAINDPGEFVIFGLLPDGGASRPDSAPPPGEPPQVEPPPPPGEPPQECRAEPPERRCAADVPEQCSATGEWEPAGAACQAGCVDGVCRECVPDTRQCSSGGVPQVCNERGAWQDEAACLAGQTCVLESGSCGECTQSDVRLCVGTLGNCSAGEQTCGADSKWGPCSIQPTEDSCQPGDDGNCDGTPNNPSTGGCECSADVKCGPNTDQGQCAFGVSSCNNGVLGPCTGAVAPQARDCRSELDNDCDGQPDNQSCECPAGSTRSCGPGPCAGLQTCQLSADASSTAWGPCTAPELGAFQAPELVAGLGVSGDLWGPSLSADGLTLVFGAGFPENIFAATRTAQAAPFSAASALAGVNSAANEGTPFLSADGLTLYLYSMGLPEGGAADRNLQRATRAALTASFGAPVPLTSLNTTADEQNPWVSTDELRIVFDSNRAGGEGSNDLWLARRVSKTGDFEAPINLDELNTTASEEGATLSDSELDIIFASSRSGGQGNLDLWLASRSSTASDFSAPVNLQVVNSSGLDLDPALSADGSELFFSSSRSGAQQLYRSARSCN